MNSKEDPSNVILGGNYPHTSLYLNSTNLGFAGGNNWGINFAKGDFILIINNDTEVVPNLIEMLLIPFEQDASTGVVCPKIKYFSNKNIIQYAGFRKMNRFTGRTVTIGNRELDQGQFDKTVPTWGAHGAAMMVKSDIIRQVGRFPESFFLYYEEWDWATRILKAGYKIYFQGLTTVYHKESMSVGILNPLKEYYLTRNRILYMRRNSNKIEFACFCLFFALFAAPKITLRHMIHWNMAFLKAFWRGVGDNFKMSSYSAV